MSDDEISLYLRAKTAAQLLGAYKNTAFGMISFPFIFEDGAVIPKTGFDALETGDYPNKVPIIIGSNKEETKIFLAFADAALPKNRAVVSEGGLSYQRPLEGQRGG